MLCLTAASVYSEKSLFLLWYSQFFSLMCWSFTSPKLDSAAGTSPFVRLRRARNQMKRVWRA